MIFSETPLKGCYTITVESKGDSRGWFARTYCKKEFLQIGHDKEWVQMNHSFTAKAGSIRGMHFQAPDSEIKLIRCISGSVFDVVIDLRKNSPTFLNWFGTEINVFNKKMMYVPAGFAHGFQTLENNTELIYSHSEYYSPKSEHGIRWNDPLIGIDWPASVSEISEKDKYHNLVNSTFKGI